MFQDAEEATFTNDLVGPWTSAIKKAADTPVGRLIAPFAKVNLNSMVYKLERIPIVNFSVAKSRRELFSLDPAVRQRAIGKLSFASSSLTALGGWLHSMDSITGTPPRGGHKWRFYEQSGHLPSSIKVGDTWVEYRAETPVGGILNLVANSALLIDAMDGTDPQMNSDIGQAAISLVAELYNPEFLTDSLTMLVDAVKAGDVKGAKAAMSLGANVASTFAPYSSFARSLNRSFEANKGKKEVFTPHSPLNSFVNKMMDIYAPWLLTPKLNILGQEIRHKDGLGPDILSPFGVRYEEDKNPVITEMDRLGQGASFYKSINTFQEADLVKVEADDAVTYSTVGYTVTDPRNGDPIRLDPAQRNELIQATAGLHLGKGNTLEDLLAKVMKSSSYKNAPDKAKGAIIQEIISGYRAMGTMYFVTKGGKEDHPRQKVFIKTMERRAKALLEEFAE